MAWHQPQPPHTRLQPRPGAATTSTVAGSRSWPTASRISPPATKQGRWVRIGCLQSGVWVVTRAELGGKQVAGFCCCCCRCCTWGSAFERERTPEAHKLCSAPTRFLPIGIASPEWIATLARSWVCHAPRPLPQYALRTPWAPAMVGLGNGVLGRFVLGRQWATSSIPTATNRPGRGLEAQKVSPYRKGAWVAAPLLATPVVVVFGRNGPKQAVESPRSGLQLAAVKLGTHTAYVSFCFNGPAPPTV